MGRPDIAVLGARRAKPLHRTFPTWAREPKGEGHVQWRMYRRHRGGALFVVFDATPDMTRREVAVKLRDFRKVLFGRDKLEAELDEPSLPESAPELESAVQQPAPPATPTQNAVAGGQGSLF